MEAAAPGAPGERAGEGARAPAHAGKARSGKTIRATKHQVAWRPRRLLPVLHNILTRLQPEPEQRLLSCELPSLHSPNEMMVSQYLLRPRYRSKGLHSPVKVTVDCFHIKSCALISPEVSNWIVSFNLLLSFGLEDSKPPCVQGELGGRGGERG